MKKLEGDGSKVYYPDVKRVYGEKLIDEEVGGVDPVDAYRCQTKTVVNVGLFRSLDLAEIYKATDAKLDGPSESVNASSY